MMTNMTELHQSGSSEARARSDFERLVHFIWARRISLSILIVVGAALGAALSYCFTPEYKADSVLVPSDEMMGLNASSALGNMGGLGGLASLVGLGGTGNKQNEAVETLRSRVLTTAYIEANNLLPILFASRWDEATKTWKSSVLSRPPTLEDAFRKFDKSIRTVVDNRKTGLITISVTWKDPELARRWVDGLVNAANDRLRTEAIARTTRNLEYLRKASEATNIMEVKSTIYKLMETEIKKQMVAYGGQDYAFRVVDPAIVTHRKVFPMRSLFALLGAVLLPAAWFVAAAFRRTIIGTAV